MFYKDRYAPLEVYNDINSSLVNLFKCVKYHPDAIKNELENVLYSRETYNNCRELYRSPALTDIQRAAMYFYMVKTSFGSRVTSFGAKSRDIANAEYLLVIKERLKRVVIENKGFDELIKQYDRPNTLFYCDPPYFGTERYYDTEGTTFDKAAHIRLRDILLTIKGKVIVSYNNAPFIKDIYKLFNIEEVQRYNSLSPKQDRGLYGELIIRNY